MWKWIMTAITLALAVAGAAYMAFTDPDPTLIVDIEVHGDHEYHVFEPGSSFEVDITPTVVLGDAAGMLAYQWVDYLGDPLTPPELLEPGERITVRSPLESMPVGYYGLRFLPDDREVRFNPETGQRRELGFAVLPVVSNRQVEPASRFGIVHFSYRDPYLNPGWMKTATEFQIGNGSQSSKRGWRKRLEPARAQGQMELPIVLGDVWNKGSLKEVRRLMRGIFKADPRFEGTTYIPAYELGIEENLGKGSFADRMPHTIEKFQIAKVERDRVDPSIKLAYQVANLGLGPYRVVMESGLGAELDVFSVHPYPWSDWPSPDIWHDEFVDDVRAIMTDNGVDIPIWYTEVGSVQNDAEVPLMFSGRRPVGDGQTRAEYAAYLIKLHAHAFDKGIEKVFWYNYKDRRTSTTNSEDHFGMRDHWGYPKPGYLAYAAMLRCMKGRTGARLVTDESIRAYSYTRGSRSCVVAWLVEDEVHSMDLTELLPDGVPVESVQVFDTVGTPQRIGAGAVPLTTYPVFLYFDTKRDRGSSEDALDEGESATALVSR
jgi:DNA-binding XRE family transcriptional regulator